MPTLDSSEYPANSARARMTTLLWLWVLSVPLKRALALALIAAVEVGQRGADGCPFGLVVEGNDIYGISDILR